MGASPFPRKRSLVLVGGGHAHLEVLRTLALAPEPALEVALVVDEPVAVYSGMVPGLVAGQYRADEIGIDLHALARRAGARLVPGAALRIDAERRCVEVEGVRSVGYDVASLDVGSSTAGRDLPGVAEHALPTRPIGRLVQRLDPLLARVRGAPGSRTPRVAVVGGGAGGVELAFALRARLRREGRADAEVDLLEAAPRVLPEVAPAAARRVVRAAARRGIRLRTGARVARVDAGGVGLEDGARVEADAVLWVGGAAGPPLLHTSGLPTDARGFVRVTSTLQVVGHPELLAAGDCAVLDAYPELPRAGVFAVRQGPVLARNLRRVLRGEPPLPYRPQRDFLRILNLGDGTAIATKWGLAVEGALVMRWKDRIDRRFVARYRGESSF